ncbi:MAG: PAS domain S-box protein [Chloroflexi bacterium]|nr:PAS domain S-box protein [Chloroflexota bacterium]
MNVLYVEDNPQDADLARRELDRRAPAFCVEVAATLAEARARLSREPRFDLVLTDVNLPDGDGLELVAEIRQSEMPLAVVVLTGLDAGAVAVAALKAGAEDYLVKGDDYLVRLPGVLNGALSRFRAEAELLRRPLRVLLHADDPGSAEAAVRHFQEHARHFVLETEAIASGILGRLPGEAAGQRGFDVLLLDYGVARIDALDLIKAVRHELRLDLPIVLVSGEGGGEIAAQALRFGASDYLEKRPGYLLELPAVIQAAHSQAETARERAALHASERRYRELVSAIPGAVYEFRIDADGRRSMPFVSEGMRALSGLDPADIEADVEVAFSRVPPSAAQALDESIAESWQRMAPWNHEFLLVSAAGEEKWVAGSALPRRHEDGSTTWHGVMMDITERRRAVLGLEESEDRYRDLVENSQDLICTHDLQGNLLSVNEAAVRLTGYSRERLLTMSLGDLLVPEAKPRLARYLAGVMANGVADGVMVVRTATGDVREWEYHNTLRDGPEPIVRGMAVDVTERRRAARAIAESEAQFRAVFHASPIPFTIVSADRVLVDVNGAFTAVSGFSREEAVGRPLDDLGLWPNAAERDRFQELTRQGRAQNVETTMRMKDGSFRTLLLSASIVPIGGEPHVLTAAVDITGRKQADIALRESESRFRALFDESPVAEALLSLDRVFVDVNQAFVDSIGYEREEMLGRGVLEVGFWLSSEDRERFLGTFLRDTRVTDFETVVRRKDGRDVVILLSARIVPVSGVPHILVSSIEITERKRAEEEVRNTRDRLDATLDAVPDLLFELDQGHRIVTFRAKQPSLLTVPPEAFLGKTPREVLPPEAAAVVERALEQCAASGQSMGAQYRLPTPAGERWFELSVARNAAAAPGQHRFVALARDITDRKEAEVEIRESQQRYERVVQHMSDALILDDAEGRVVFASARFFELFAIPEDRRDGITIEDYVAPEWRDALVERHRRRMAGEPVPEHFEYEGVRADGTRLWLEVVVAPVAQDGRVVGTQSTIRDISERKVREDALRLLSTGVAHLRGEAFFQRMASEMARLLGLDIGFVGRLIEGTPRRIRTLGWFVDGQVLPDVEYDLPDTPCERVVDAETVVFASGVQEEFPADTMLVEMGITGYAAVPLFASDGQPLGHIGVMSRRPLDQPGQVEAILRLFAVRTAAEIERQRTEAQFQDLFKYSPDGIIIVGQNGAITAANPQAESLFGYTGQELAGLGVEALVPGEHRGGHGALRAGFIEGGISRAMGSGRPNLRAMRKDGTTFPVEISLSPMEVEGGQVVVATLRDTTARVAAEAERDALEAQLRQAQKMEAIGTLAGGIAHDFNNILAAIIGNAELAAMDLDAHHPAMETVGEIRRASNRAKDLVRQILAFSRHQEQPRVTMLLDPVVVEVTRLIRATLPAAVEVAMSVDHGAPPVVADASQVHQVLMNLATNAWHALDGHPGRIDMRLDGVDLDAGFARHMGDLQPGRYARLSVTDTGKGMDAATIERIFEPFFTTKEVGSGTGLGLAVVHGIVRGHGGAINVTSEPDRGSTFEVYLPAAASGGQEQAQEELSFPRGEGEHVLYLDDEEPLAAVGRRLLEHIGYRATAFTDPALAIAAVTGDPGAFDLVLTDLNMPGISGLDVIREVQRIRPGLATALISGFTSAELHAEADTLGVAAFINKPVAVADLAVAVHRALASRVQAQRRGPRTPGAG